VIPRSLFAYFLSRILAVFKFASWGYFVFDTQVSAVSGMEQLVKTHVKQVIVNLSEVKVRDCFGFHRKMLIFIGV
jgi:hypothetical protein